MSVVVAYTCTSAGGIIRWFVCSRKTVAMFRSRLQSYISEVSSRSSRL